MKNLGVSFLIFPNFESTKIFLSLTHSLYSLSLIFGPSSSVPHPFSRILIVYATLQPVPLVLVRAHLSMQVHVSVQPPWVLTAKQAQGPHFHTDIKLTFALLGTLIPLDFIWSVPTRCTLSLFVQWLCNWHPQPQNHLDFLEPNCFPELHWHEANVDIDFSFVCG